MFRWRYLDTAGAETGSSESFADRASAEAWLGESWTDLLAGGVEEVVLLEGQHELYRMGLRET